MDVKIERSELPGASIPATYNLIRNGRFIIGDASEDLALQNQRDLEANNWRFLDCFRLGQEPLAWIAHVRSKGWSERGWNVFHSGGRIYFDGSVDEIDTCFSFVILCPELAACVRDAVSARPIPPDPSQLPDGVEDRSIIAVGIPPARKTAGTKRKDMVVASNVGRKPAGTRASGERAAAAGKPGDEHVSVPAKQEPDVQLGLFG